MKTQKILLNLDIPGRKVDSRPDGDKVPKCYHFHPTHRQQAGKYVQICDKHSVLNPNVWVDLHFSKENLSRETSWLQACLTRTWREHFFQNIFSVDDQCETICLRLYRKTGVQPAPKKGKSWDCYASNIIVLLNLNVKVWPKIMTYQTSQVSGPWYCHLVLFFNKGCSDLPTHSISDK